MSLWNKRKTIGEFCHPSKKQRVLSGTLLFLPPAIFSHSLSKCFNLKVINLLELNKNIFSYHIYCSQTFFKKDNSSMDAFSSYAFWMCFAILVLNNFFQFLKIPHALIYFPAICLSGLHLYNRRYCRCDGNKCYVSSKDFELGS